MSSPQVIVRLDRPACMLGDYVRGTVSVMYGDVLPQHPAHEIKVKFRGEMVAWQHKQGISSLVGDVFDASHYNRYVHESRHGEIKVPASPVTQGPQGLYQEAQFQIQVPENLNASWISPNEKFPEHSSHESWFVEAEFSHGMFGSEHKGFAPIFIAERFDPNTMTQTLADKHTDHFVTHNGHLKGELFCPNCVIQAGVLRASLAVENASTTAVCERIHIRLYKRARVLMGENGTYGMNGEHDVCYADYVMPGFGSGPFQIPIEIQLPPHCQLSLIRSRQYNSHLELSAELVFGGATNSQTFKINEIVVYPVMEQVNGIFVPKIPSVPTPGWMPVQQPMVPPAYPMQQQQQPMMPPAYPMQQQQPMMPPAYPMQQQQQPMMPPAYPMQQQQQPMMPPAYPMQQQQMMPSAYPMQEPPMYGQPQMQYGQPAGSPMQQQQQQPPIYGQPQMQYGQPAGYPMQQQQQQPYYGQEEQEESEHRRHHHHHHREEDGY